MTDHLSDEIGKALSIIEGNGEFSGSTPINASDATRTLLSRWFLKAVALEDRVRALEELRSEKRATRDN